MTTKWRSSVHLAIAALSSTVVAGCAGGCGSAASEDDAGDDAKVDVGTDQPACQDVHELCSCGAVGCPCDEGGACLEGSCNPHSNTCVLEEDGMVFVPEGWFWMGCRDGVDTDDITGPCPQDELPYREVFLDAYWIDEHEVTKGAYRECMEAGVCEAPYLWDQEWYKGVDDNNEAIFEPGRDDMPTASVNWTQAKTYCEWAGKRLPTEAEWEKAARGVDGRKYPWGAQEPTCELANYGETCPHKDEYKSHTPVGMFPAGTSPFGLLDAAGNVKEWVADGYLDGVGYEGLPDKNPTGVVSDYGRVRRGGHYSAAVLAFGGYLLRVSARSDGGVEGVTTLAQGLRCSNAQ